MIAFVHNCRRLWAASLIGCSILLATVSTVVAADICEAVAIRDVAVLESASSVLRKGQIDDAVSQYRVNKRNGQTSFCSHGGSCYPTHVQVGGDFLEALKLTNCRIVNGQPYDSGDYLIYGVEPIRSAIPRDALRLDDLDNKFLEMGLCSACAANVALYYLKQPGSQCAKLAQAALEGDPEALAKLEQNPSYCVWPH